MYKANLSHQGLEKFLEILTSKGLLMKDSDSYKTTSKGLEFINEFEKIQLLMGESRKQSLNTINLGLKMNAKIETAELSSSSI